MPPDRWNRERWTIPPAQGYDMALRGFMAEAKRRGVEPNFEFFHRTMKGLLGEQTPEPPEFKFGGAPKPRDPSGPEREEDF